MKPENIKHTTKKGRIRRKLGRFATKVKLFFKNHFPKRVWNKAQEKNKGHKF